MEQGRQATSDSTDTTVPTKAQDNFHDCLCFELRRTMRLVTQVYDAQFQETGVRSTQFPLLAALLNGPASLKELAATLTLEHSTLVRSIRPLVDAGLVKLTKGKDRRLRIASLTDAGAQKVEEIAPLWRETQSELVGGLGDQDWYELRAHLRAIRKLIHRGKQNEDQGDAASSV